MLLFMLKACLNALKGVCFAHFFLNIILGGSLWNSSKCADLRKQCVKQMRNTCAFFSREIWPLHRLQFHAGEIWFLPLIGIKLKKKNPNLAAPFYGKLWLADFFHPYISTPVNYRRGWGWGWGEVEEEKKKICFRTLPLPIFSQKRRSNCWV